MRNLQFAAVRTTSNDRSRAHRLVDLYLGFSFLVVKLLVLNFERLKVKGQHKVLFGEAFTRAVGWFLAAMAFAGCYWWFVDGAHGREVANANTVEHVTGYLIEKALATENVFIWVTIFTYFAVAQDFQKRVLLFGVIGAIVMRAELIYVGASFIEKLQWTFYIFSLFLLAAGVKMLLFADQTLDLAKNPVIRWIRTQG